MSTKTKNGVCDGGLLYISCQRLN